MMGRSNWVLSLLIGAVVSGVLLAGYHVSSVFFIAVVKMEAAFRQLFVLPPSEAMAFHLPLQYGYFTLLAFLSVWICLELPHWFNRLAYLAGAVFLTWLLAPVLAFCGVLFEPLSGTAAILLAGLPGMACGAAGPMQRARRLQQLFVGRVSTWQFQKLVVSKEAWNRLGEKKEITVLDCRILNFGELCGQMEPRELEKMGSFFLRAAAEFLVSKGAYLDSCHAQGVRVFFGMLESRDSGHAFEGCGVALELRQRLANLEREILSKWHRKPVFGVALATGEMSVGLFGFREFQFFSAVGEPVDFCRRLCGVNRVYGSQVLIGARTYQLAKETVEARPMELVYAPRQHQISEVYELLGEKGKLSEREQRARDEFWHGVVHLRKGAYEEAVEHLKSAQVEDRDDAPLRYFLERAEAGLRGDAAQEPERGVASHLRILTAG